MQSDWPSASTAAAYAAPARLSSPRWKKPSSGPLPRTGNGSQRPNLCPRGPIRSRSELKRRLGASAEATSLAVAEAEAARGSHAIVCVNGGLDELGPAGVRLDAGHGTVHGLWSGADEVTLLAAAAAFRERTDRAPRRPDAGELFDAIKGSVSPDIDGGKAYDRLNGFEGEFLDGTLGASDGPHGRRVRDLCDAVWGAVDVVLQTPPDDDPDGEEDVDEGRLVTGDGVSDTDERCLAAERASKTAPLPRLDAQTPSEAPFPSAMDLDVVSALPSPSRSTKQRLFHPQPEPSVDDGHPGRVASPRRLGVSARGAGDSAVPVDGEHDDVHEDEGDGSARRLELADHGAARNSHKAWSDADEVTLPNAAVAFRKRTGRAPRGRDARVLFRSIRGAISPHIDEAKTSDKLGRFRRMFRNEAPGEFATEHDHRVRDLNAKVWGRFDARDEGAVMPVVTQLLGEFWKVNERAMAGLPLEKGLLLLGKSEARLIETKWRQLLGEEMQTQMQRYDLAKEICALLNDTIMDLGP